MKKGICFCLALLLLFAAAASAGAENGAVTAAGAEAAAEKNVFSEDLVREQSFALAMACWLGGYPDYENGDLLLMDAAGWYAALQARYGCDLLSGEDVMDFLRAVGYTGELQLPSGWEEYGVVTVLTSRDGQQFYDFNSHKRQLSEMLGATVEYRLEATDERSVHVTIINHYADGDTAEWSYGLAYAKNEDPASAFPYRLTGLIATPFEPRIEGDVDFDWGDLLYANRLDTVLMSCPSVFIESDVGGRTDRWLFRTEERMVDISRNGDESYGQINGIDFRRDGAGRRVLVGRIDPPEQAEAAFNRALSNVFSDLVTMDLLRTEEENYVLDCKSRAGTRVLMTVNRLTLWVLELDGLADDGSLLYRYTFRYDRQPPHFSLLDGWDAQLRTVTLVWEDYRGGKANRRTEFVRVPADWEVLPYEERWGEFTVYMDLGYTRPYQYPGDGIDYTLYLTTAKG